MGLEKDLEKENNSIIEGLTPEHLETLTDINKYPRNPLSIFFPRAFKNMYKFSRLVEPKEIISYRELEKQKLASVSYNAIRDPIISITPKGEALINFHNSKQSSKRKRFYGALIGFI